MPTRPPMPARAPTRCASRGCRSRRAPAPWTAARWRATRRRASTATSRRPSTTPTIPATSRRGATTTDETATTGLARTRSNRENFNSVLSVALRLCVRPSVRPPRDASVVVAAPGIDELEEPALPLGNVQELEAPVVEHLEPLLPGGLVQVLLASAALLPLDEVDPQQPVAGALHERGDSPARLGPLADLVVVPGALCARHGPSSSRKILVDSPLAARHFGKVRSERTPAAPDTPNRETAAWPCCTCWAPAPPSATRAAPPPCSPSRAAGARWWWTAGATS